MQAYDDVIPYVELVDSQSAERVTFFELLTAMALQRLRRRPGRRRRSSRSGWAAAGTRPTSSTRIVQVITPVSLDHRELGDTVAQVAREKAGILRPDALRGARQPDPRRRPPCCCARPASSARRSPARALEFGVVSRSVALGGPADHADAGSAASTTRSSFRCTAPTRRTTRPARWRPSRRSSGPARAALLDIDTVRAGFAAADSPGRLETVRSSPTIVLDGAHNEAGRQGAGRGADRGVRLRPAGRRHRDPCATRTSRPCSRRSSRCSARSSSRRVRSPRAMPVDELAAEAVDIFGGGPGRRRAAPGRRPRRRRAHRRGRGPARWQRSDRHRVAGDRRRGAAPAAPLAHSRRPPGPE